MLEQTNQTLSLDSVSLFLRYLPACKKQAWSIYYWFWRYGQQINHAIWLTKNKTKTNEILWKYRFVTLKSPNVNWTSHSLCQTKFAAAKILRTALLLASTCNCNNLSKTFSSCQTVKKWSWSIILLLQGLF